MSILGNLKIKMATSKSNKFEEYVKGLLDLLKEWGASFSNNGLKEDRSVQLNLQTNAETMESMELGGTNNQIRSTFKSINQAAIRVYKFFYTCLCAIGTGIGILFGIGLLIVGSLVCFLFIYDLTLRFLEGVGVAIPEEYWAYDRNPRGYIGVWE